MNNSNDSKKDSNKDSERFPNYDGTVGKHPIPHAEGMAKDENRDMERRGKGNKDYKGGEEEE